MFIVLRRRDLWLALLMACIAFVSVFLAISRTAALGASGGAIYQGPSNEKQVAFACNVVWGTQYVMPIAKAFQAEGFKATFFLGGAWAKTHPQEAKELVTMGMALGNHGYGHRHVGQLSLQQNESEITRAQTAIEAATGVKTSLYAPAYGEVNKTVIQAADALGYKVIMWTIDTIDWRKSHTPAVIEQRVLSRLKPGAIILIHPTDRTLKALPGLLQTFQKKGYNAVTVQHLLGGTSAPLRSPL